jgi:hypothetical protein
LNEKVFNFGKKEIKKEKTKRNSDEKNFLNYGKKKIEICEQGLREKMNLRKEVSVEMNERRGKNFGKNQ